MAWEAPGGIVCNLGTLCLTRKEALGIALHVVHSSPLPMTASPGGAPLPLERVWGVGIRSFFFSCSPHQISGKGKSSSGSMWHLQPHISLTLCKSNLLAVPQVSPDPGNGSSKEPGFWEPYWPQGWPQCNQLPSPASSHLTLEPHCFAWSFAQVLQVLAELCVKSAAILALLWFLVL